MGAIRGRETMNRNGHEWWRGTSPVMEIFSPAGASVAGFGLGQQELTLTETGTYTIEIRANNSQSTGGIQ